MCDERRILQALNNIISNAIKYSNDPAQIDIRAQILNKEFKIIIEDKGIGMSPYDIDIALTKYGTIKKRKYNHIDSYGLGLVIVKKLMEAHDGRLDIESAVNVGSKITLSFPQYKIVS